MAEAGTPALERCYRWLVRWYPRGYQHEYADEMVGVLLADSPPGRRWPEPAAVADLVVGGVRAWLRRGAAPAGEGPWRNAAAVVGLLVPVALLAHLVPGVLQLVRFWTVLPARYDVEFGLQVGAVLPWAAVLVAVLAGRIRAAAGLAVAAVTVQAVVWLAMAVTGWRLGLGMELLGLAGAVALARRPPARHAARVLGRRSTVLAVVLVPAVLAAVDGRTYLTGLGANPVLGRWGTGPLARLEGWVRWPLAVELGLHNALAALLAGVLVAFVSLRVGLAVAVRLAALVAPALAVGIALPPLGGPADLVPRLAAVAMVAAAAGLLTAAAGAALTWATRLLRRPG